MQIHGSAQPRIINVLTQRVTVFGFFLAVAFDFLLDRWCDFHSKTNAKRA